MDQKIKDKLDALVGTTVKFAGDNYHVQKWKIIGGNYCVVTDKRTLQFYPDEVQRKFLNVIASPDQVAPKQEQVYTSNQLVIPSENSTIKESLLEVLKRVKDDPGYIDQAKGVCNVVNTLVSIQKVEIEMHKLNERM